MKSNVLIFTALCFAKMLLAQDSIRVETVTDTAFKTPQYVGVYDDVFLSHKETKWLLKADLIGLLGLVNGPVFGSYIFNKPIGLEFEHKLSKAVSINSGISAHVLRDYSQLTLLLEPRWYFNKNKSMAENSSANNLNGSYLSLRGKATRRFLADERANYDRNTWSFAVNYGIQKRVLNNFYVNYRVGLGYGAKDLPGTTTIIENQKKEWFIDSDFTLGLAFGGGKKQATNTCDLFRCYETEKSLWKFDISNLFPSLNKTYRATNLSSAYEFKVGKNEAWSINTGLDLTLSGYRYSLFSSTGVRSDNLNYSTAYLSVAPRYYYNLKKNIAKGKSANNLSGCYFSLEIGGGASSSLKKLATLFPTSYLGVDLGSSKFLDIIPKWGIQKRLFKNGFVDFSFAPYWYEFRNKSTYSYFNGNNFNTTKHNFLKTDFKIGFAF